MIKPSPTGFNLASLVQQATDLENAGAEYDDLESNLQAHAELTQPLPSGSESRQTLLSQVELPPAAPQSHRNKKRALKRRKKVAEDGHKAKHRTLVEHVMPSEPIGTKLELLALPVAKGGYSACGRRRRTWDPPFLEKELSLSDLKDLGITVFSWNGR